MATTLSFEINKKLKKRFKNYCNDHDMPMKDVLDIAIRLIMKSKDDIQ